MDDTGRDRELRTEQERFDAIREDFLARLADSGQARTELYTEPKPGRCESTEQQVVRSWAAALHVSLNDILIGLQNAFAFAAENGKVVTSFRWCVPHIVNRLAEVRGARVGRR